MLVARDAIVTEGLRPPPLTLAIDICYEPNPAPFTLPARIDEPCVRAELPSPPRK